MFQVAQYTDVSSEESLDGRAGFNYASASPNFSGTDRHTGESYMLHSVDAMSAEVESFTYRQVDGRFYFSRGRTLGATHSGRSGNHLTRMAVTGDVEDLGAYTPAQILGAANWTETRAPERVLEPWRTPVLLPEWLGSAQVLSWVCSDADRRAFFPRLLSALQSRLTQQDSSRIALVHSDPQVVLRWLAAAGLLLNDVAVRSLSVCGMLTDAAHVDADVLCCTPAALTSIPPGSMVCDLKELSGGLDSDAFGVQRSMALLEQDMPTAPQTIALARRWDPAVGELPAFWGAELVSGVLQPGGEIQDADMVLALVENLAGNGFAQDLEKYREEFAAAFRKCRKDLPGDAVSVARAAHRTADSGNADLSAILLEALLQVSLEHPRVFPQCARELTGHEPMRWPGEPVRWTERLSDVAERLADADLPAVFAVLEPLRDSLDQDFWAQQAHRYAQHLTANPEEVHATQDLWNGLHIREDLRSLLLPQLEAAVLGAGQPVEPNGVLQDLMRQAWNELARISGGDSTTSAKEFTQWQQTANFAAADPKERLRVLRKGEQGCTFEVWPAALTGTTPLEEPKLWLEWVTAHGSSRKLESFVLSVVQPKISQAANGDLKHWEALLEAMQRSASSPDNDRTQELRRVQNEISEKLQKRPGLLRKASERFRRSNGNPREVGSAAENDVGDLKDRDGLSTGAPHARGGSAGPGHRHDDPSGGRDAQRGH
ncbi:GAP1-N2 domain-containing protein [Kocuria tytonis]|uniref:GTPase-associated protein 1 N-terminal domain-containing protein n=1 Tax=Kocuria tytonis TaxID=2054280 RepID=A0A495AAI7_9MICC|nr:hypothetical protein [Kocuria tytonis]RKQ36783.1 hypothetical protein C1C97_003975 [Kocuria tytonis]